MRLATVALADGSEVAGVVTDEAVFVIAGESVLGLVQGGLDRALSLGSAALAGRGIPLGEVALLLPYRPPSVRDFVTFEAHVEGVRRSVDGSRGVPEAWYDAPTFYFTNPHALYGPGSAIRRPRLSRALDFELEVGCVVGASGSDWSVEEAQAAIFGYTIVNDWSARDLQSREMKVGLGPAKGKDFATSIGPWIVTAEELAPRHTDAGRLGLSASVSVNGVSVGGDSLANMHWSFPEMIAYAARDSVVLAGDLLASGTTGGGGCLAELWGRRGRQDPPPLEPGDVVTMTVDGIGTLTGSVASER